MKQLSELSESEIEDRFHVTGQKPVQFLLAGLAKQREQCLVLFNEGNTHFLSLLIACPADEDTLYFDCSGSKEINQGLLEAKKVTFVAKPEGIHIQFVTGPARRVTLNGVETFAVKLPPHIVRMQRREYFRMETPRINPLTLSVQLPNLGIQRWPVHDLSIAGMGVSLDSPIESLASGTILEQCMLRLPDEKTDMRLSLEARCCKEIFSSNGKTSWRLGLRFVRLNRGDEAKIQRYIAHLEHERRSMS